VDGLEYLNAWIAEQEAAALKGDAEEGSATAEVTVNEYAPFELDLADELDDVNTLMLSEKEMLGFMATFEKGGRYGNGYAWADIALQVMREEAPSLEAKVQMDPEAGMWAATSADKAALEQLASLLHTACSTPKRLEELIAAAPFEYD